MRVVNIISAVVLILFGCFYSYLTLHLPDRNLPNTLGSSFMPWVLVICLYGLAILLLLQSLFKVSAETCDYAISKKEGTGILFLIVLVIVYIDEGSGETVRTGIMVCSQSMILPHYCKIRISISV